MWACVMQRRGVKCQLGNSEHVCSMEEMKVRPQLTHTHTHDAPRGSRNEVLVSHNYGDQRQSRDGPTLC